MVALLALAILADATLAPVAAELPQRTDRVRYADLDLTMPSDRDRLEQRLRATINRACHSLVFGRDLTSDEEVRCRSEAMADARRQVSLVVARYGEPASATRPSLIAGK